MFPSLKKNLIQDKVTATKSSFVGAKRALLAMVVGSVMSYASTTLPSTDSVSVGFKQNNIESSFVLEPKAGPMQVAWHSSHGSHGSHGSHESHSSHYSSRY